MKVSRRTVVKFVGTSALSGTCLLSKADTDQKKHLSSRSGVKPAEEMRPREILDALGRGAYAFVPISPGLEWHSYHLPMGTDAIIPEEISRLMTELVGGIWLKPLSLGLDSWRTPQEKLYWGLAKNEKVFGMNFPSLPLHSEYCSSEDMIKIVSNRVKALQASGVKNIFLINHHKGKGQVETLKEVEKSTSTESNRVYSVTTYQFNDLTPEEGWRSRGGHAGVSETTWLAAFRPDLVDLNEIDEGELNVRTTGILHKGPAIEPEWNPREISMVVANKLKSRVISNFSDFIDSI